MSRTAKLCCFVAVVAVNLSILCWRLTREKVDIQAVGPHVAALGALQADTVLVWRNAASVPFEPDAINNFVNQLSWGNCGPISSDAVAVDRDQLSQAEQQNLCQVIGGLIQAYSEDRPEDLYDFMASIDESLSLENVETLKQLLIKDWGMSATSLEARSPRELFLLIAEKVHYDSHWDSLVANSACVTLWRTRLDPAHVLDSIPLGEHASGLFKNQTRYHHLFQCSSIQQTRDIPSETLFADVQFVVKHDNKLKHEPSSYHVRFILDRNVQQWRPVELIHVATISASSPTLMF